MQGVLIDDPMARRIRAAIALGGYSGVPALANALGAGWGQDNLYAVLGGKKEIPDYVVREIARVCEVPYEFIVRGFDGVATNGTPSAQDQLDAIQQMVGNILSIHADTYADFIRDVRNTLIPLAGEIQNELDSARLLHETPTQRLEQANEHQPRRSTGRRRTP